MKRKKKRIWPVAVVVFVLITAISMGSVLANTNGGLFPEGGTAPAAQEAPLPGGLPADPAQPAPEETPEPEPTGLPEATPSEIPEPAPTETELPSDSPSPTASVSPSASAAPEDSPSASTEPSPTESASPSPPASTEPSPSPSPSQSATPTISPEPTPTVYDQPAIFPGEIAALGSDADLALTDAQIKEIEAYIGDGGTTDIRRAVVEKAYSLVGKLPYFWGGKSATLGWDVRWLNDAIVGSAGSTQTGTTRPYGLDCSGYTLWAMVNALGRTDADFINSIGWSTVDQWNNSQEVAWEDALPGDFVFYGAPANTDANHVGIVVGKNADGALMAAHESSSQNNVIITPARDAGFTRVRRLHAVAQNDAAQQQNTLAAVPLAGEPIRVTVQGTATNYATMEAAFNFIKGNNKADKYTVQLTADYTYTAADDAALKAMGKPAATEVVITSNNTYTLLGAQEMNLPENWPSGTTTFTFQSIKTGPRTFYANNSPLVMGVGVSMPSGKCSVYGSTAGGKYGAPFTTNVTIKSGSYAVVCGGFGPKSTTDAATTSSMNVTVTGGTIDTLYGSSQDAFVLGNVTVNISGGTITNVVGTPKANINALGSGATNINISGGKVNTVSAMDAYMIGSPRRRYSNINITGNVTAGTLRRFDRLDIAAGKTLTVTNSMDYSGNNDISQGALRFNGNSTLVSKIPPAGAARNFTAGYLYIKGANNRIKFMQNAPLFLGTNRATQTDGNKLILGPYANNAGASEGDIILQCVAGGVLNADHFAVDFGSFSPSLEQSGQVLRLRGPKIRVTNTSPAGVKTENGFFTMAEAFGHIAAENKTGDYEIALLTDYLFTKADADALSGISVKLNAKTVSVTGKPGADGPVYAMTGVQAVTLPDQGPLPQDMKTTFICHDLVSSARSIYARATPIVLGENCSLNDERFMQLFGGYQNDPGTPYESSVVMRSGSMGVLSGGSEKGTSSPDSVYNVEVDGPVHVANLFGAGSTSYEAQRMDGDATLRVKSGTVETITGLSSAVLSTPGKRTDIYVEGGAVTTIKGAGTSNGTGGRTTSVYMDATMEIPTVQGFDLLQIAPGQTLTVTKGLDSGAAYGGAKGVIRFGKPTEAGGANLVLRIENPGPTTAGTFEVYGAGNTLQTYRTGVLTLGSPTPVSGDGNLLTLKSFGSSTGYADGDPVLKFTTEANADISKFNHQFIGYRLEKSGGNIVLDTVNFRVVRRNLSNLATYSGDFVTFADAVAHIKSQNEDGYYDITLYRDYTFTPADNALISTLTGLKATQISFDGYNDAAFISSQSLVLPEGQNTIWSFDKMKIDLTSAPDGNNRIECRRTPIAIGPAVDAVVGGSLPNGLILYGDSPAQTEGTKGTSIKIQGGRYARVVGACDRAANKPIFNAPIEIAIGGGTFNGPVIGGDSGGNTKILAGYGNATVQDLYAFDVLEISLGRTFTITGNITSTQDYAAAKGLIRFKGGSTLITNNANPATDGMKAGTFEIEGAGNVLRSLKGKPLTMSGGPVTGGGTLQLGPYADGAAPALGDMLVSFTQKESANAANYTLGFGEPSWALYGSEGGIYIAENVIRVTHTPVAGAPTQTTYPTLADAFRFVRAGDQPGKYAVEAIKPYAYNNSSVTPWSDPAEDQAALLDMTWLAASEVTIAAAGSSGGMMSIPNTLPEQIGVPQANKTTYILRGMNSLEGSAFYAQASPVVFDIGNSSLSNITLYGGYEREPANTFYQTDIALAGGTVGTVYGGSKIVAEGPSGLTRPEFHVTISGGRVNSNVYGGSSTISSTKGDTANITVDITGGEIGSAVYGSMKIDGDTGKVEVNYSAGRIGGYGEPPGRIGGVENGLNPSRNGDVTINANANLSNTSVMQFDTFDIAAGTKVSTPIISSEGGLKGNVVFNGNSTLDTSEGDWSRVNYIGSLTVNGGGNKLILKKYGKHAPPGANLSAGIFLSGSAPHAGSGVLKVELSPYDVPEVGDVLIKYTSVNAADVADPSKFDFTALGIPVLARSGADPFGPGVYLYLGYSATLEQKQADGTWGAPAGYDGIAGALNAVGNGTGDYRITVIQNDYVMTAEDGMAFMTQGGRAASLTFTSNDKWVKVGGDLSLYAASPNTKYVFDNIQLDYTAVNGKLHANGHPVSFGTADPGSKGIVCKSKDNLPEIFGGSKDTPLTANPSLTFYAGTYGMVYGGGEEAGATVTGDTTITVYGMDTELSGGYGGGKAGDVTGTSTVNIYGGKYRSTSSGQAVAGGKTGSVGNAVITVVAGNSTGGVVGIAGAEDGAVQGNVTMNLSLTEAASGPVGGNVKLDVFGVYGAGSVGGDVNIYMNAFNRYRTISGGGRPGSANAATCVAGAKNIYFKANQGSVRPNVQDIVYFDLLQIGSEGRANLTVTGDLDSSPGAADGTRTGTLLLSHSSVLDLNNDVANARHVGNIETDGAAGGDRCHFHVRKTAAGSQPMLVDGFNSSGAAADGNLNQLVVGLIAEAPPASGDEVFVFHTPANAVAEQYVSDYSGFEVYVKDGNKIALGHTGDLNVNQVSVRHTSAATTPGGTAGVNKTITLLFDTRMDGGTWGADVTSAYISTHWDPDAAWAGGGTVPAGDTAVVLANNGNHT